MLSFIPQVEDKQMEQQSPGNRFGKSCLLLSRELPMAALMGGFCSFLSDEPHGGKSVNSQSVFDMDTSLKNRRGVV